MNKEIMARKVRGIKLSSEEEQAIQELADQNGMNFSEYVRKASLGEINIPNKRLEEMFMEIRNEIRKLADKKQK